jgi:hypothetical protein
MESPEILKITGGYREIARKRTGDGEKEGH